MFQREQIFHLIKRYTDSNLRTIQPPPKQDKQKQEKKEKLSVIICIEFVGCFFLQNYNLKVRCLVLYLDRM